MKKSTRKPNTRGSSAGKPRTGSRNSAAGRPQATAGFKSYYNRTRNKGIM